MFVCLFGVGRCGCFRVLLPVCVYVRMCSFACVCMPELQCVCACLCLCACIFTCVCVDVLVSHVCMRGCGCVLSICDAVHAVYLFVLQ